MFAVVFGAVVTGLGVLILVIYATQDSSFGAEEAVGTVIALIGLLGPPLVLWVVVACRRGSEEKRLYTESMLEGELSSGKPACGHRRAWPGANGYRYTGTPLLFFSLYCGVWCSGLHCEAL